MSWGMVAVAGATVVGSVISSKAASSAADAQSQAAQQGLDAQRQQFERSVELNEPFRQAGISSQNRLLTYLGLPGAETGSPLYNKYSGDFSMKDFQQDPGYNFRLSEGLKALDRQAAARGGLISGSALKAAQNYGQDAASQEYQNAFNRYQVNRANQLNPLQSLMGAGQTATNTLTGVGQNYANNMAEGYAGMGNARASGYVGQANAINNGISGLSNAWMNNRLISQYSAPQVTQQAPASGGGSSGGGGLMGGLGGMLGGLF